MESGEDVTVYDSMAAPPSLVEPVNEILIELGATALAVPIIGADGAVGTNVETAAESVEGSENPALFLAVTLNLYEVPCAKPVIVLVSEVAALKAVIQLPPLFDVYSIL